MVFFPEITLPPLLPLAGEGGPEGRMRAAPTAWPLILTFSHARVGERELLRRQSAVDHDLRAGDERRFVARQKQDRVRDLFRAPEAAERRCAGEALAGAFRVLGAGDHLLHHRGVGEGRVHRI